MNDQSSPRPWHRVTLVVVAGLAVVLALLFFVFVFGPSGVPENDFVRLMNVGKAQLEQGKPADAIATYRQALALDPVNPDVHLNLANAYFLAGQYGEAIAQAREVLGLEPASAAAPYVIGLAHLRLGQFEAAIKALQESQKADRAVTPLNFQLGLAYEGLRRTDDAVREYQTVIDFEPEHPAAHYRLSQLYRRNGQIPEADQELAQHREILAKRPNPPGDPAFYERCKHTAPRVPFRLEQPDRAGVRVVFRDVTPDVLPNAANYRAPVGVIDVAHDGRNSLFVAEGEQAFRLLLSTNGQFRPSGPALPVSPAGGFRRCLVGDLNNDRTEDIVVLGSQGCRVFRLDGGVFSDVTAFARLADLQAADGVLADLEFTGKLGLLAVLAGGDGMRFFRNLGTGTAFFFQDVTAASGLPATSPGLAQVTVEDWNNDDLPDVFLGRPGQPPFWLPKVRGGPVIATNIPPADWPAGAVITTGDFNNDLRPDLVVVANDRIEVVLNATTDRLRIPLSGGSITAIQPIDYDNDGWLDLCAIGEGIRIWRNLGRDGFRETTAELGLDQVVRGKVDSLVAADFNADGATDLAVAVPGRGLVILQNEGAAANRQMKLRLLGSRSNSSGLGMRVELTAGNWRTSRTVHQLPIEIGLGRRTLLDSIAIRWYDTTDSVIDVKVDQPGVLAIAEIEKQTTSCPYLYAWDGKACRFVSDVLGAAPLGLPVRAGRLIDADPEELLWLGDGSRFQPRNGSYELRYTEELREVLYLDQSQLLVVDHPAGTEVHSTSKLLPGKPFLPHELVTLQNRHALVRASQADGQEVTAQLQENDGRMVSPPRLRTKQLRGLAEPHSLTLDFGPLPSARPLVLVMTGWLRFGGAMANMAASHYPDLPFPFPTLEAEVTSGHWKPVDVVVGAPAGKTKTILVDLGGRLPADARRLRLGAAYELHWDRIALFEKRDAADTRVFTIDPTSADLRWRGISETADLPWDQPLTPVYGQVRQDAYWRTIPSGWCTRYGRVDELVRGRDNALALVNAGDELTVRFDAGGIPPQPAGRLRDFFVRSVGWDKDIDFHVISGPAVEPLPWHGMDDQLYGRQSRPVFANDAWIEKYNSRWVGPLMTVRTRRP